MRAFAVIFATLTFAACAVFGGGGGPDPLAGWGGVWSGSYYGSAGDVGALELEFTTDTAGVPTGVARFDTGGGPTQAPLEDLILTADSLYTVLYFQGLSAQIAGSRSEERAQGSYLIRPEGQDQVMDSGTWEIARQVTGG